MIVKKVKNPKKSASKSERVSRLADYIRSPEREDKTEKCVYAGARGFFSDDPKAQKLEMLALAEAATRSRDPINHYVLSWREGETPTPEQAEQAVTILLKELGLEKHQAIYGLHKDTENQHLHVMVNRVHPETERVIEPNGGFDIKAAHRALARIEHEQGWQREARGCYRVTEKGDVEQVTNRPSRGVTEPAQEKRDRELRTGEKSAERIGREEGAPLIRKATSWRELHEALAARGMRLERKGSGAKLFVGDVQVKASRIGRDCSFGALEKRLGAFEPAPEGLVVKERPREPLQKDSPAWTEFSLRKRAHAEEKARAWVALRSRHEEERASLREAKKSLEEELRGRLEAQKRSPEKLTRDEWKALLQELQEERGLGVAERAKARVEMKERHEKEVEELRKKYPSYPDYKTWQSQREKEKQTMNVQVSKEKKPAVIEGEKLTTATPRDLPDYDGRIVLGAVEYRPRGKASQEKASFIDKGSKVEIHDRDPKSVHAALVLSALKWKELHIDGDKEVEEQAVKVAAERGVSIKNPELKEKLAEERQTLKARQAEQEPPRDAKAAPARTLELTKEEEARAAKTAPARSIEISESPVGSMLGDDEKKKDIGVETFRSLGVNGQVYYLHKDHPEKIQKELPAFVDRGKRVDVHDLKRPESVLAALQVSAEKWGSFKVEGKKEFIDQVVALAAEHGFKVKNPELQERIEAERERLKEEKNRDAVIEPANGAEKQAVRKTEQTQATREVLQQKVPEAEAKTRIPSIPQETEVKEPAPSKAQETEAKELRESILAPERVATEQAKPEPGPLTPDNVEKKRQGLEQVSTSDLLARFRGEKGDEQETTAVDPRLAQEEVAKKRQELERASTPDLVAGLRREVDRLQGRETSPELAREEAPRPLSDKEMLAAYNKAAGLPERAPSLIELVNAQITKGLAGQEPSQEKPERQIGQDAREEELAKTVEAVSVRPIIQVEVPAAARTIAQEQDRGNDGPER